MWCCTHLEGHTIVALGHENEGRKGKKVERKVEERSSMEGNQKSEINKRNYFWRLVERERVKAHWWCGTTVSFPLMSSKRDWVFEAVMMSDETIRSAPEISSLKEKGVSEDAEIWQSSKERAEILYVCGDNGRTERLRPLIMFQKGER